MQLREQTVLLVEDEAMIALFVALLIEDEGGQVTGPIESNRRALAFLDSGPHVTCAVLDVHLRDGESTPIALRLRELDIPFIIHTAGAVPSRLRQEFGDVEVVTKPAPPAKLIGALASATTARVA